MVGIPPGLSDFLAFGRVGSKAEARTSINPKGVRASGTRDTLRQ